MTGASPTSGAPPGNEHTSPTPNVLPGSEGVGLVLEDHMWCWLVAENNYRHAVIRMLRDGTTALTLYRWASCADTGTPVPPKFGTPQFTAAYRNALADRIESRPRAARADRARVELYRRHAPRYEAALSRRYAERGQPVSAHALGSDPDRPWSQVYASPADEHLAADRALDRWAIAVAISRRSRATLLKVAGLLEARSADLADDDATFVLDVRTLGPDVLDAATDEAVSAAVAVLRSAAAPSESGPGPSSAVAAPHTATVDQLGRKRVPLPDGRTRLNRLILKPASSITLKRVVWLWSDRVPLGMLTLTPGRGGVGKSTFHAWLIAQLTRGDLPGCFSGVPKSAIIAATEDDWERTIGPRLVAAGADLDRVHKIDVDRTVNGSTAIHLPTDVDELGELIREHDVALVSVDPLLSFLSESTDTYKDREVRTVLEPLVAMAAATDCVILGNAHFTKSGTDPMTSIMGSAAFANVARAALAFAMDTDTGLGVVSQVKNNLGRLDLPNLSYQIEQAIVPTGDGPSEVSRFVWKGTSARSVAEVLGDTRSAEERSASRDAATFVTGYLTDRGGSAPAGEVLAAGAAEGHSERTLKRARKSAGATTRQVVGGWVWALPADHDLVPQA